ncbi:DUF6286 domain-containing protein [Rhodococcus sp. 27YEA15]|uniref:DUF6286 domain-containing protein n=1 Tax=Rhodococcus sp. 27YEA15 TaxID=3156259 RepID=UPI003C7C20BE
MLPRESSPEERVPVATAGAVLVGVVLAMGVLAVGVVAIRDTLVATGLLAGPSWIVRALDAADGIGYQSWMLPAGIAAVVVGGCILTLSLKPRSKRANRVVGQPDLWIAPRDVASVATVRAESVDGVLSAKAKASRRRLVVRLTIAGVDPVDVEAKARAVVAHLTESLSPVPRLVIRSDVRR